MNIFLGLDASKEELGLKRQNIWAFVSNDVTGDLDKYQALSQEEVQDAGSVPLMFVSFPSAKVCGS